MRYEITDFANSFRLWSLPRQMMPCWRADERCLRASRNFILYLSIRPRRSTLNRRRYKGTEEQEAMTGRDKDVYIKTSIQSYNSLCVKILNTYIPYSNSKARDTFTAALLSRLQSAPQCSGILVRAVDRILLYVKNFMMVSQTVQSYRVDKWPHTHKRTLHPVMGTLNYCSY